MEKEYINAINKYFSARTPKAKEECKSAVDFYAVELCNANPSYRKLTRGELYAKCKEIIEK